MVEGKDRMGVERERNRWRATDMYTCTVGSISNRWVEDLAGVKPSLSKKEMAPF